MEHTMSSKNGLQEEIINTLLEMSSVDKNIKFDVLLTQYLLDSTEKEFENSYKFKEYVSNKNVNFDKLSEFLDFSSLNDNANFLENSILPLVKIDDSIKISSDGAKRRVYDFLNRLEEINSLYATITGTNRKWFINLKLKEFLPSN